MNLRAVKGMNDILPEEIGRWHRLENTFRELVELYRYEEVRPPLVEPTALFVRQIGEVTDIVEKEMYSFDHHGEDLTLRPEGTAGVARAYVEHNIHTREPVSRWYYLGPMFRSEKPQKGRYRQFYQAGCEIFGDPGPAIDAEMIDMLVKLMDKLGIKKVSACINSLGAAGTRARYREALVAHLTPLKAGLSEDSQRRLERSPLRILDSKDPRDAEVIAGAPSILDLLDEDDRAHFESLCRYLDRLRTPYVVEPRLVRGFDYYTRTLFELRAEGGELGSQNALGGGGRYDRMVHELGGPEVPAIGFALGLERILLAMPEKPNPRRKSVLLAPLGESATAEALAIAKSLRSYGIAADVDGRKASLKSMLRRANATGAAFCVIVGDTELARGIVQVKDLNAHSQEDLSRVDVARILADRIRSSHPPGGA
ncbi:MAG TPA: histidine--tRNA ligase [Polyangiaceae bacterium]